MTTDTQPDASAHAPSAAPGDAPSVLAGRYLLGARIGYGGMGVVYRGWDTVLQRDVAVKVLRTLLADPAGLARFRAEGDVLARLDHPGLVRMYDTGDLDGSPYLVMELVEGGTLAQRLDRGPLTPRHVVALGIALAGILAHVHGHGITHRDVKPGNILLDPQDGVRLVDFGVARVPGGEEHTLPGVTMGTAAYISPEQVRGERATSASDVYALGLVLVEALTGRQAYPGPADAAAAARLSAPPALTDVPASLRRLLAGMTATDPYRRPSASAVQAWLQALLAAPVTAASLTTSVVPGVFPFPGPVPGPGPGPEPVPAPRRRVFAAAVAAGLMLPVLTVLTCLLVTGGDRPAAGGPADPGRDMVRVAVEQAAPQAGPVPVGRIGTPVATRRAAEPYVQSKDGAHHR